MNEDKTAAIRQRIKGLDFAQPIDLGCGVITRSEVLLQRRFKRRLKLIQIPQDLTGKSVLDIGTWDGFFAFECEKRRASRVMAIDTYVWDLHGMATFRAAREILNSKVEDRRQDIHELSPDNVGCFDVVLMLGVFYHLRNPLLALERVKSITRELLILETHVLLPFIHEKYPLIPFFPGDENAVNSKYEMCAMPTIESLKQMLRAVGFEDIQVKYTPSFRHWKKFIALLANRPQSGRCIVHARLKKA
jgi:tRNA (mo5U34)-methyltransferase